MFQEQTYMCIKYVWIYAHVYVCMCIYVSVGGHSARTVCKCHV